MIHLTGLLLPQLLPIFAVLGSAVVVLYILKLKRRVVFVPFTPLFSRLLQNKHATSLFSQLRRILSLLLQLVLLALLLLALGNPKPSTNILEGRSLVVLLDTSASMLAANEQEENRLTQAKAKIRELIGKLNGNDRMLIISMSHESVALTPMTNDVSLLNESLNSLQASHAPAHFAHGLRLAFDILSNATHPEVLIVSDGALDDAKDEFGTIAPQQIKLSWIPIGHSDRNIAITQFAVRRYSLDRSRYEVMVEIYNSSKTDEDVELSLFGEDTLVDMTKLHVKSGERLLRFYPSLGGASRTLRAKIRTITAGKPNSDDLEVDNQAFAVLPERKKTKILLATSGNTYLEAALLLDEYLDVTTVHPNQFDKLSSRFDAAIYDGFSPPLKKGLPAIYLDIRSGGPLEIKPGQIQEPGFDLLQRKHPILRWTALDAVGIKLASKMIAKPEDKVLGASSEGPLLVAGSRDGTKFVAFGFDIRQSDLPLRIAWPVLLINCLQWFENDSADYISSYKTGDIWKIPAPLGSKDTVFWVDPLGHKTQVPIVDGRVTLPGSLAGIHKLIPSNQDLDKTVLFAANLLNADESSIASRDKLLIHDKEAGAFVDFQAGMRKDFWIYILLLVCALSAIEWATYHRRITV